MGDYEHYFYAMQFGEVTKVGVTYDVDKRALQIQSTLGKKADLVMRMGFQSIDEAEDVEYYIKNCGMFEIVPHKKIKTEIFYCSAQDAFNAVYDAQSAGLIVKAVNSRNAGRKPNLWESRQMMIPDPIRDEVTELIAKFKKSQKEESK